MTAPRTRSVARCVSIDAQVAIPGVAPATPDASAAHAVEVKALAKRVLAEKRAQSQPQSIRNDRVAPVLAQVQASQVLEGSATARASVVEWDPETSRRIRWFSAATLPAPPFQLWPWARVTGPLFYERLRKQIEQGPRGAYARTGALQDTLCRLDALVGGRDGG